MFLGYILGSAKEGGLEQLSPADHLNLTDFEWTQEKFCFYENDTRITAVIGSNSMDPVLDEYTNTIQIAPKSIDDVHVGDIVSYQTPKGPYIHRVIEIRNNSIRAKGDNNLVPDPGLIPFENILGVVVAIIY